MFHYTIFALLFVFLIYEVHSFQTLISSKSLIKAYAATLDEVVENKKFTKNIDSDDVIVPSIDSIRTTREVQDEAELTSFQRISRSVDFYKDAVPVFTSYKILEAQIRFEREVLKREISEKEEEERYDKLHEWGSIKITAAIERLKGFYVKTGQIISTRVDIFPKQFTSRLAFLQDALDPIDGKVIKEIVQKELLQGAPLDELFSSFDEKPLGSASIAQVHRATLLDGRVVAVKVQRPGIRSKLLGDIGNLINFASVVSDSLPIDYYKVFCELERTLIYELDFLFEAQATMKVASAVSHTPSNKETTPPVIVPLPVNGLVTKRVMVLEYVNGTALSQIAKGMQDSGVEVGSEEAVFFGKKLLTSLTASYGNMIFGSGIIHGDPHPGNIFVTPSGQVALLDCGQVKQLNTDQRIRLAKLVVTVSEWEDANDHDPKGEETTKLVSKLAKMVKNFGVYFQEETEDECAAAVAILLFGSTGTALPGGYSAEEISQDSPIVKVREFPQEFILLGRATVMIKGIANRLGVPWGLSRRWASMAQEALDSTAPEERLPVWSAAIPQTYKVWDGRSTFKSNEATSGLGTTASSKSIIRFSEVIMSFNKTFKLIKQYTVGKCVRLADRHLSMKMKQKLLRVFLKISKFVNRFQPQIDQ